jgi:hypothetical protein
MAAARTTRVRISRRALVQRINRALAKDGARLTAVRSRGGREPGDYHHVDQNGRAKPVDVEKLGRELGVLRPFEEVQR